MEENGETSKIDLKQLAVEIILDEYIGYIDSWMTTATKNEIKGLKVVSAVIKHHGKKRFKPRKNKSGMSIGTTAQQLHKKYMQSYYNAEYCTNDGQHNSESDILKYRRLTELKCACVLKKNALLFIESWLTLKDEQEYQTAMLTFLRGIYSVVKTQSAVPISSHMDYFSWFSKDEQKRATENRKVSEGPVEVKSAHVRANSHELKIGTPLKKIDYNPYGHKMRNLQNMKGNGEITSWVSNISSTNNSLYQDSYIPQFYKRNNIPKADFHTSIVFRLLPNQ